MSELKKNFVQGKMNKDYDVRLIPEGEYIDAFNVLVSNSEGSQVGSVQNSFGIDKITSLTLPADAETIGSVSDEGNECIYWFVASNSGNYIFEYDQLLNVTSTVLEDSRTTGNVLNFNKQYKITGCNVIYNSFNKEKLLVWTDDLNAIRCINIKTAKSYGPATNINPTFLSKDISLYKRQPHFAPVCVPTTTGNGIENNIKERFLSFGYRWKYLDGEYSAISTFSNPQFYPGKFRLDYDTNENIGMINKFNSVNITFGTGDKNVTDVQLVFKESNSNSIWIIDTFNKKKLFWGDNLNKSFSFDNNKIYSVLPEDEVNRLFDNVPIVAKAQEFIGNRLIYGNYVEGRDMIDASNRNVNVNYTVGVTSEELSSVLVNSTSLSDILEIDFTGKTLNAGDILNIAFRATSPSTYFGNYLFDKQLFLSSSYTDAAALQASNEFQTFITVVSSTDFANYDTQSNPPAHIDVTYFPFEILPSTGANIIRIKLPRVRYKIDLTPTYENEIYTIYDNSDYVTISNGNAFSSCKSNRSYEVGISYLDDDGRYSTIITNNHSNSFNNLFIPILNSTTKNSLYLTISHKAPSWATKYKVFVKDNKLEYQTVYGVIVHRDTNYVWVKLEGQDKNKVQDGDFLIVKRNINGPNQTLYKTQVLEYKQQISDFVLDNGVTEKPGNYIKLKNAGGIYIDSLLSLGQNNINATGNAVSNVDSAFLHIGPFSKYDTTTSTWNDIPITAGSKITIHVQNEKLGNDGGFYSFDKEYVSVGDYINVQQWFSFEGNGLGVFSEYSWVRDYSNPTGGLYLKVRSIMNGNPNRGSFMDGTFDVISSQGVVIFETDPKDKSSEVYFETPDTYLIDSNGNHLSNRTTVDGDQDQFGITIPAIVNLSFFNCYTQGNGAESYVVKDLFNANFLSTNTRPNAVQLDGYKERRNIASLTYSGGLEKSTNYNSLNEFNLSRANYKDLDDKYGRIQKLFSRDTDLVVFQEDKLHKILYNKNLLSDAVGGGQITSVEDVLGQEIPVTGEWGIGTHPETFSNYATNIYFTDQPKGVVLRLGADGLEPISRYGMKDWFRDNLRDYSSSFIVGGYDPSYDNYILGFTDETKQRRTFKVQCNQQVNNLTIPVDSSISYEINIGDKVGDYEFIYDIFGDTLVNVVVYIGEDVFRNTGLSGSGNVIIPRTTTDEIATVVIENPSTEDEVVISFSNVCPITDELEVITLVVNDTADTSLSMKNQYTWVDSTYGYNGISSDTESFDSTGLTRFRSEIGVEADGPIPFEGSTIRLSSFKVSGEFTNCNRLGYIITSDDLDASELLADATYVPVTTDGDENYIEFTFERSGDLTKKLYMVWDYIDNVYAANNERLMNVNLAGSFTINALDGVTKEDPYTIEILTDATFGTTAISGDNITYLNDGFGYDSDFFVYRISSGGCRVDIRVDILINLPISCSTYTLENISAEDSGRVWYIDCFGAQKIMTVAASSTTSLCANDVWKTDPEITKENIGPCSEIYCRQYKIFSSDGINSCDYIDCDGVPQTISVDGTSGYVEDYFCATTLVGLYNNVIDIGVCIIA